MSQFYKVLKADPLGEPWTPNFAGAKPTQNYWCQVEGEEWNVSIGKQVPNTVNPGESIYGDLIKVTSQKGTNYWKFKSQKIPEGVQRPASSPAQATAQAATTQSDMTGAVPGWFIPYANMMEYVYKQLKDMDANPPVEDKPVPKQEENIIDPQTKAMLDEMFAPSEPETPEDV